MNILFVTAPAPSFAPFYTSEKRPPLGVGYLIATLRKAGHAVFFEDLYTENKPIFESVEYLKTNKIDVLGISTSSICYGEALKLLHKVQGFREQGVWKGLIMVGGPHTSFNAEKIPEFVDHIVIGEGESACLGIVEGAIHERIVRAPFIEDLDSLPPLPWADFIHRKYDWTLEGTATPAYTFNTSRGCPFSCTFCSVKGIWGRSYRFMSAERVVEDVEMMKRYYGLQTAYFREDHFTLNKKRTTDFCDLLLKKNIKIDWSCETRADCIEDPAIVELMARSGCKRLYIGVESGSPNILTLLKKGETVEQFERTISLARNYGIKTYASLVVGVPGEVEKDRQMTIDFVERVKPDFVAYNVFVGLPGSDIFSTIKEHNLIEYEDDVTGVIYLKGHNIRARKFYGQDTPLLSPVESPDYEYLPLEIEEKITANEKHGAHEGCSFFKRIAKTIFK